MHSFKEYLIESVGKKLYQLTQKEVLDAVEELAKAKKALKAIPKWEQQENYTRTDERGNEFTVFTPKYEKATKEFNAARQMIISLFELKGTKYNKYAAGPKQLDPQQQAERLSKADAIKIHNVAIQTAIKNGINIDEKILKDYQHT